MNIFYRLRHNRNNPGIVVLHPLKSADNVRQIAPFGSSYAELSDLSYEEALADLQFRRFLKAEYGEVEPPDRSKAAIMMAIYEHQNGGTLQTTPTSPLRDHTPKWSFDAARVFANPLAGRMATGIAGLAVMLAVLTPNAPGLLRQARTGLYYTHSAETVIDSDRTMTQRRLQALRRNASQVYDQSALLSADPPDTLSPPRRPLTYANVNPALDDTGSYAAKLRKE